MKTDEKEKLNNFEKGLGIAGLLLSMTLLSALIENKTLTTDQANTIIDHARSSSENPEYFPGNSETIYAAHTALEVVRKHVILKTSPKASA